jgi:hypothetical protein
MGTAIKPPEGAEKFSGDFATYWFDEEGILHSLSNGSTRTLETARRTFELLKSKTKGKKVCTIAYVTMSKKPDQATRDYVTRELPSVYKAMALVSKSGVGRLIMSVLFRFQKPAVPMKTFSDAAKAKVWLRQYR